MKTFADEFATLNIDAMSLRMYATTTEDVERALLNPTGDLTSLMALLSPAAMAYLEPMAQQAAALTRQRFGANLGLFIPLYVSNLCANECDYCGFSMSNKVKRKTLSLDELNQEVAIIKQRGFDSVLLVSGEHETKVGPSYFEAIMPYIKAQFSHVAIEIQPLETLDYQRLARLGVDAVMVYQETYRSHTYAKHHTRGKKQDFNYRLTSADRIANAGIDKIGLGVLLGLDDWRMDALLMAHHLDYLEKTYWRTRYSISLPRLRPCTGGITPKVELSDAGLVQLICAFRLFNPQVEMSLSTRELPSLRDNLLPLGITHLSAGSSTQPGGYHNPKTELDQFDINDERTVEQVVSALKLRGFNPLWKDWEMAWINVP
ncbi:2-iminoacetate synthase ThiH [Shewanella basaltis]|uniref:2-iminoacetate synthase ThiH n=1 Tax=Shewanella basaltis TaxID=472183 RepID=UPI00200C31CF|nr:2-iminoacetate synthase ThiH [Shewanella basaltis]MCL1114763.1 2-iminoacetate synthase ThiH [Shewanella basaltis]